LVQWIDRAAERGARLTRQLLAFSRHQALRPERVDLRSRSEEITELLSRSLRGDIRIVVTLANDLWSIECDVGELELALLNVCVNSRDAMPDGGLVRIDGRNLTLPADGAPRPNVVGDYVVISVTDTGAGIESAALARVFEPFFTTKEVGKGTGLGLSQVLGFATQAGGTATIRSEVGKGTTVKMYLPRAASAAMADAAAEHGPLVHGTGRILVVEDDDAVAGTAVQLLELIGYGSRRVQDARTALAMLLGGERFRSGVFRHHHARRHERPRVGAEDPPALPAGADPVGERLQPRRGRGRQGGVPHHRQALSRRRPGRRHPPGRHRRQDREAGQRLSRSAPRARRSPSASRPRGCWRSPAPCGEASVP
jgi:hypothetical protein